MSLSISQEFEKSTYLLRTCHARLFGATPGRGRRFLHVNASRYGGGSPETLNRLVPIMQDLGIDAAWEVIVGDPEFYGTVRALDLALEGQPQQIADGMLQSYVESAAANAADL